MDLTQTEQPTAPAPTTEPAEFKDALKPGKLARPMDPMARSNDAAQLRALCGMLNDPRISGAEAPPEPVKKSLAPELPTIDNDNSAAFAQAAQSEAAIMAAANAAPVADVKPQRAPTPPTPAPALQQPAQNSFKLPAGQRRIFFTGASRVGKSWLAAQLGARFMEIEDPIRAMAAESFGDTLKEVDFEPFAKEVYAWGEGIVSAKYPLTASRSLFANTIRAAGPEFSRFGLSGFWIERLLERVEGFQREFPGELVVVTDVGSPAQYQFLREHGFAAFHVTCNNITRRGRGGSEYVPPLAQSIDRDVTAKLSQSPRGNKLWCIWCDDKYPPPSQRMLTTGEFIRGAK